MTPILSQSFPIAKKTQSLFTQTMNITNKTTSRTAFPEGSQSYSYNNPSVLIK